MSYLSVAGVRNGSVVVVKVNPAASTAFLDPELDQEAGKIQTGKYLALLSGISVDQDGNSLTNMYFIGPGMPRHDPRYDEDETMSIPISPAKTHPMSRQPLQLGRPLPWPDCYVRTILTERQVRVSSVTPSATAKPFVLKDTEFKALVSLSEADLRRAKPSDIVMPASDSGSESDLSSEGDDNGWQVELQARPSELVLTFDVWLDVGGVLASGVPDPSRLRSELEQLYILQDRDTRRHYAQYRRLKRETHTNPAELGIAEEVVERKKLSKGTGFGGLRSWISRFFRKLFRRKRV